MRKQTTLVRPVSVSGIGLHTGASVRVTVRPAPVDHGIVFRRVDLAGRAEIPALPDRARSFDHATTLADPDSGARVSTVEHLLAAAYGLGLSNVLVDIDAPEVPILDGSAAPWVRAFREGGLALQNAEVETLVVDRTVTVADGSRKIEVRPARELRVTYTVDYAHPALGRQSMTVAVTPELFADHIAPARTFGFLSDYEELKRHGLARGASLENCIVIGESEIQNGPLRYPDEFVRHKILDLLGDLALLGQPLVGHVVATKAGHSLHARLAEALMKPEPVWRVPDLPSAPRGACGK